MNSILTQKKEYLGLGIMSGSSLDGIDIAAIKFYFDNQEFKNFEILNGETFPYDERWLARIEHLPFASALDFAKTHVQYGHLLGKKVIEFCKKYKIKPDFVASHGHTIFHQPKKSLTFQIGCGQTLVSYLKCPVVNDFRSKDVANGGQGAPLVPLVEKELFPKINIFLNLGGFVNISIYKNPQILGYDITACNRVLNYYAWKFQKIPFDSDGKIASQGKANIELLNLVNSLNYFYLPPPKSLGNEWLEENIYPLLDEWAKKIGYESILATWVEHIVHQIQLALKNINNPKVLITGGGIKNKFLKQSIQKSVESIELIETNETLVDFKESLVFAYLGLKTLLGKKHFYLDKITGGKNTVLGSVHLP